MATVRSSHFGRRCLAISSLHVKTSSVTPFPIPRLSPSQTPRLQTDKNPIRPMKVVILCGGKGTRLREETEYRPKPMVPIGDRPILWHIMKFYAAHGHNDFVLCLGYKGEMIKDYFRN